MDSNGSLPYSEDGEKGVLSSLILSPKETAKLCTRRLGPEVFDAPAHRIIYELIIESINSGQAKLELDAKIDFIWLRQTLKRRGFLDEIGGPEFLDKLYNFIPTAANADYYIGLVCESYGLRRLVLTCDRFSGRCREPQVEAAPPLAEAEREITEIVHSNNGASARLPEWLKLEDVDELPDKEPETVIENLLRVGEKLGITSGSKSFKTWLLLYIGFCIANGLDFLGVKTYRSKVIIFDLELPRNSLKRRLRRIQQMLGKGNFENIKVCSLRGKALKFCREFQSLKNQVMDDGFKVVIIDPVYKFLLGQEENSNGIVADMLEQLTVFCMGAQVALLYVHHHSKGNQATKESLDRGSGAGAWARDPDALMDLTSHNAGSKKAPVYTCSIAVRDFPPIEDFVVRWEFPILIRDTEGLDPTELKQADKGGRPKDNNTDIIMAVFRAYEGEWRRDRQAGFGSDTDS